MHAGRRYAGRLSYEEKSPLTAALPGPVRRARGAKVGYHPKTAPINRSPYKTERRRLQPAL